MLSFLTVGHAAALYTSYKVQPQTKYTSTADEFFDSLPQRGLIAGVTSQVTIGQETLVLDYIGSGILTNVIGCAGGQALGDQEIRVVVDGKEYLIRQEVEGRVRLIAGHFDRLNSVSSSGSTAQNAGSEAEYSGVSMPQTTIANNGPAYIYHPSKAAERQGIKFKDRVQVYVTSFANTPLAGAYNRAMALVLPSENILGEVV